MNSFKLINTYKMLNNCLTKEEYLFLNEARDSMEALMHVPELESRNPGDTWLRKMQPIHQRIFGGAFPNIGCRACIRESLKKLYSKLQQYEATN